MLNYPEHLVSFMALHTTGQATTVQLPASHHGVTSPAASEPRVSTLVESLAGLDPRERRTAIISLVPRLPQDMTLHVSVVLDDTAAPAASALEFCGTHSLSYCIW